MALRSIKLLALWGNGDTEGHIYLSQREWNHVCRGGCLSCSGMGCYEGEWFDISCTFAKGRAHVTGNDGADMMEGRISRLLPRDLKTGTSLTAPDPAAVLPDPPLPARVFSKGTVRKAHQPAVIAALRRIAPPASQSAECDSAVGAPETFSLDEATATLTTGAGRVAPPLRVESPQLRAGILRELGCYEDEVGKYEEKGKQRGGKG